MDRNAREDFIRDLYYARRSADLERVMESFHPQAQFRMAGSKAHGALPDAAIGHESLRAVFAQLFAAFEFLAQDFRAILVQDDRAAVHAHVRMRFRPTGEEFETEILDLLTFEGDLIRELTEFVDTAMVAELGRRAAAR